MGFFCLFVFLNTLSWEAQVTMKNSTTHQPRDMYSTHDPVTCFLVQLISKPISVQVSVCVFVKFLLCRQSVGGLSHVIIAHL